MYGSGGESTYHDSAIRALEQSRRARESRFVPAILPSSRAIPCGMQVPDIQVGGGSVLGQRRIEVLRLLEVIKDLQLPRRQFLLLDPDLRFHSCPPMVWARAA